jgi:ferredoxin
MRVVHDASRCATTGMCEAVAPDLFAVGDDGILVVLDAQPPEASRSLVERAVAACPTGALTLEE